MVYSILSTSYSSVDESRIPWLDRVRWLNAQHTTLSRLDWQSFSATNTPDPGKEDVMCSEGPQGSQSEQGCGTHAHNIRKVRYPLLITWRCDRLFGIILQSIMFQLINNYPECVHRKQRSPEAEALSRGGGGCIFPCVHFASLWPPCLKHHHADLDVSFLLSWVNFLQSIITAGIL